MGTGTARTTFVDGSGILPEAVVSTVGYRFTGLTPGLHRGLPSLSLTLVLGLDNPIVTGDSPEHALGSDADRQNIVLGGLHTRPVPIAQPGTQTGIQLAVHPLAARSLFGFPAGELPGAAIDGADALGESITRVWDRVAGLSTWHDRFTTLNHHLRRRSERQQHRSEPRPEVAAAWQWITMRRGTGSIEELARHVALSRRQLTALFRVELGLTPKAVSGLARFEHAHQRLLRAARADRPLDIAGIAAACGYYDHSHLVADFHRYTDTTPSDRASQERRNLQAGSRQEP